MAHTIDKIAVDRILADTVRRTQYGWRVECRPEFNDDRSAAAAYWPKRNHRSDTGWSCRCYQFAMSGGHRGGDCSHIRAIQMLAHEIEIPAEFASDFDSDQF